MKTVLKPAVLRAVLLPLLGAAGAVAAMVWPLGYNTFCAGLNGLVV
jgi:hypothetical protein